MDPNLQSSQRIKRDLALISSALLYSHRWHAGESVRSIDSRTKSVDRVGSFGLDKFYVLLCTSMWSHVTFSIRSTVVLQWFYPSCSVHTITVTSEHCRAQWAENGVGEDGEIFWTSSPTITNMDICNPQEVLTASKSGATGHCCVLRTSVHVDRHHMAPKVTQVHLRSNLV